MHAAFSARGPLWNTALNTHDSLTCSAFGASGPLWNTALNTHDSLTCSVSPAASYILDIKAALCSANVNSHLPSYLLNLQVAAPRQRTQMNNNLDWIGSLELNLTTTKANSMRLLVKLLILILYRLLLIQLSSRISLRCPS